MIGYDASKAILDKFRNFEECIINQIVLKNFGESLEITINNIWNTNGNLRNDLEKESLFRIICSSIQMFEYTNNINHEKRENTNWSAMEIHEVLLDDATNKVTINWESGEKTVSVVCASIDIQQIFEKNFEGYTQM